MKTIYLYWFNSAVMTTYEFRNFSASRFYYCVLYITFGLITTTANSQSFDQLVGRFTQLDVAQFNPSSIILQGEIKVTQKSTFERLLEKPLRSLQAGIPVSAGRLASLGKGFLRGGLYGIALDGDGDRLIMIDSQGRTYDGDLLVYVIARVRHQNKRLNGGVIGT